MTFSFFLLAFYVLGAIIAAVIINNYNSKNSPLEHFPRQYILASWIFVYVYVTSADIYR